jgi:predicted acylesterase/phospholipase RssA
MSIGAINAAIIAGNTEDARIDQLKRFWDQVTSDAPWSWLDPAGFGLARGDGARHLLSRLSATQALASGANGFFAYLHYNTVVLVQERGIIGACQQRPEQRRRWPSGFLPLSNDRTLG